jgi:hypothetical protein
MYIVGAVLIATALHGTMRWHGKEAQVSDQQQRIAIAEACGWTRKKGIRAWNRPNNNGWDCLEQLPDYTNDLNAMHEAEKVLTAEQRRSYVNCIFNLPVSECESNTFATAAQRAKAFLRAIGKWEDKQ